jgi:ribosomal protein S11
VNIEIRSTVSTLQNSRQKHLELHKDAVPHVVAAPQYCIASVSRWLAIANLLGNITKATPVPHDRNRTLSVGEKLELH